jgi:RNA polymerase primary sigma factor
MVVRLMKSMSQCSASAAGSSKQRSKPAPQSARLTPSEELQLACRRDECRREILALLVNTPACIAELRRLQSEVSQGKLAIDHVLEMCEQTPAQGLVLFSNWIEGAQRLQRDSAEAWQGQETSAAHLQACRQHVSSLALVSDVFSCLARGSSAAPISSAPLPIPSSLPASWQRQLRSLATELLKIRERFLAANQGLVAHVVERYLGNAASRQDLMQEGNIGLLRGIEKFDPRRGGRFGTYAVWWIRQGVRRAIANQGRMIRIPVHAVASRYALDRASQRVVAQSGREPTRGELASATGLRLEAVVRLLDVAQEPLSLDAPRGPETTLCGLDGLVDPSTEDGLDRVLTEQQEQHVQILLGTLSSREREMVRLRFGLEGSDEQSYEEIGSLFSVTRERVRQIVAGALEKLHRQTCALQLSLTDISRAG